MSNNQRVIKRRNKGENYESWSFVNPRWLLILLIVFGIVQYAMSKIVDYRGLRINDNIIIKRALSDNSGIINISSVGIIVAIIHLVIMIVVIYASVKILPNEEKHDRLRLAGAFVAIGTLFKVILSFVNLDIVLNIEIKNSIRIPIFNCADIYIVIGLIAMILIIMKNYSVKETEDIINRWRIDRKRK